MKSNLNACEKFDTKKGVWSNIAPMPVKTLRHALSVNKLDNYIYCIGGWENGAIASKVVEKYDAKNDSWFTCAPMGVPRRLLGTAVLNGKIYAFGGSREEPNWYIKDVECYDPKVNQWSKMPDLPVKGECSAATVGEMIYVFVCGKGVYQCTPDKIGNKFEVMNKTCDLPLPDWYAFDVVPHGHSVYIFGGSEKGQWSDAFYRYDTIAHTFEKMPNMTAPRRRTAATFCKLDE